jgi:polysaccharide export outer membrane protein
MVKYLFVGLLALIMGVIGTPQADAQASYRLSAGDTLSFQVLEDPSLNRNLLVLPDGTVSIPNVGVVSAAGQTLTTLDRAVTQGLAPFFAQPPTVFLSVVALAQPKAPAPARQPAPAAVISIYALGEFAKPGKFDVAPGTTLLQFLAATGGLTRFAATKRLQLRRASPGNPERVYTINYRDLAAGATRGAPIQLVEGDVIIAPERRLFE